MRFRRTRVLSIVLGFALLAPATRGWAATVGTPRAAARVPEELSLQDAATKIGRSVMLGTGSSISPNLFFLMRQHALKREGKTDVFYMATFAAKSNFSDSVVDRWHPHLFFVSQGNRDVASRASEGKATLHRASLFKLGQQLEKEEIEPRPDTLVVRVSPPDAEGNVSLGTTSDLTKTVFDHVSKNGGTIIADINPNVPHMRGNRVPYSSLSYVVKTDDPLSEAPQIPPMEAELAIGKNVAQLIPKNRRSTVQLGIGNALAAVGGFLRGKRLDIWSEMGPAGLISLVTGDHPTARKATFSFLHATNADYAAASNHPNIEMQPSTVVNDPAVIASKRRMVAINTALEVDIFGNVNAERDGDHIISFPGGQPDFTEGASLAPDGKSILALRSTSAKAGSTIVMSLKGPTTTPKNHVDHVVTEWGTTQRLRGKSDAFRAYEIIRVAHPLERQALAEAALKAGILDQHQADRLVRSVSPSIARAPLAMRQKLAQIALDRHLLTEKQHAEIALTAERTVEATE